mgnify:FL=1
MKSKLIWKCYGEWKCCFDTPCVLFPFYGFDGNIYHFQSRYVGKENVAILEKLLLAEPIRYKSLSDELMAKIFKANGF